MNTHYLVMMDLKADGRAVAFAAALDNWLGLLKEEGAILGWTLMRRKLNLAGPDYSDFLLDIELESMAQLDDAFRFLGRRGDEAVRRYDQVRQHVASASYALYRPFPDPEHVERLAVI